MIALGILFQNKGAGADRIGGKITVVNILGSTEHEGHTSNLCQQAGVRSRCIDLNGIFVDDINAGNQRQISSLRDVIALFGNVIIHNLCTRFSVKLCAVGVCYILTQLQLQAQAIICKFPGLCQTRDIIALTVHVNQRLKDLIQNVGICLTITGMRNVKAVVGHIH